MPSIFQDVFASSGGKWFNFTNIKGIFWPQPGLGILKTPNIQITQFQYEKSVLKYLLESIQESPRLPSMP